MHVLVRYVLKQMFGLLQSYGRTFEIIIGKTYHPGIERGKTFAVLITVLYEIAGGLIQQRVGSIGMPLLERRLRQQQYITGIVIAVHFFRFRPVKDRHGGISHFMPQQAFCLHKIPVIATGTACRNSH